MKRFLISAAFFLITSTGFAYEAWLSSTTVTADTTKNLCVNKRGVLHGVIISSSVAASSLIVYNSSAAAINPIAVIDSSAKGSYLYDVIASTVNKGLTYSTIGTAASTILYNCY